MLRITSLSLAATLILYEGVLRILVPHITDGQNQFDTNVVRLENYTDSEKTPDTIIVGSSMAARLQDRDLPTNWENISLSGGSAMTGLAVVAQSRSLPKYILIETNLLDRPADDDTLRAVAGGLQPLLRRIFWLHRDAYKPANLLRHAYSVIAERYRRSRQPEEPGMPPDASRLLRDQQRSYAQPPDMTVVERNLRFIDQFARQAVARGVRIGFLDMPVDRSLIRTVRNTTLNNAVAGRFSPTRFCWVEIGQGEAWRTGDGIHLIPTDAKMVASRLSYRRCRNGLDRDLK